MFFLAVRQQHLNLNCTKIALAELCGPSTGLNGDSPSILVIECDSDRIESVDLVDGVVGEKFCVLFDQLHHLLRLVDEDCPRLGHVTPVQLHAVHLLRLETRDLFRKNDLKAFLNEQADSISLLRK